jgi:hypothetical protein
MVAALRSQMLDPSGPTPSVEALLHAHCRASSSTIRMRDACSPSSISPTARAGAR